MIVEWFLNVLGSVLSWLLGLLPHLSVPSWFSDAQGAAATVANALTGVSSWLPWQVLLLAVGVTMSAVLVSVAIRGFRIVASFLTAGGGS